MEFNDLISVRVLGEVPKRCLFPLESIVIQYLLGTLERFYLMTVLKKVACLLEKNPLTAIRGFHGVSNNFFYISEAGVKVVIGFPQAIVVDSGRPFC